MKLEEEKKLVEKIVSGDENAFEQFYGIFFPRVYKYAYKKVRNREQAEDVTSETFLKALRGLSKFESKMDGGLDIWMYTIERNIIRDFFRKNAGIDVLPFEETWNRVLDPLIEDPYITIERKEIDETIAKCLSELPDQYRDILKMRFFKRMSLREIATSLDKTVGAVKVLQFRALRRLKKLVEEKINAQ